MSDRGRRSRSTSGDSSETRPLAGSGRIAVAMLVMNLATYGFSMLAARAIGPTAYGAFFALMNLLMIVNVVPLGLQTTAARRISADPAHAGQVEHEILRVGIRAGLLLGALLLLAAPVVDSLLELDSVPMAALAALAAVPMTLAGAQAGVLQGERRWRELSVLYVLSGVPRLVVGLALVLWQPSAFAAFLGVALGYLAPFLYGTRVVRRRRADQRTHARHGFLPVLREALLNSQALFAYVALTNADMIVGRSLLDAHDSGLYAAGLIVSRAVLFLPQFVVVVAFPSLSTAAGRSRALVTSLALVAALGTACVVGTALLPDLALVFAGGQEYQEVGGLLWMFALLGTITALLQLLVYSVLARQGARSGLLVWVALALLVVLASSTVSTIAGLLGVVIGVEAALLAVLGAIALHQGRSRRTPEVLPRPARDGE